MVHITVRFNFFHGKHLHPQTRQFQLLYVYTAQPYTNNRVGRTKERTEAKESRAIEINKCVRTVLVQQPQLGAVYGFQPLPGPSFSLLSLDVLVISLAMRMQATTPLAAALKDSFGDSFTSGSDVVDAGIEFLRFRGATLGATLVPGFGAGSGACFLLAAFSFGGLVTESLRIRNVRCSSVSLPFNTKTQKHTNKPRRRKEKGRLECCLQYARS